MDYLSKYESLLYDALTDGSLRIEDITKGVAELNASVALAPENFGITTFQLLVTCAVMGVSPDELGRMSLKDKSAIERSAEASMANGALTIDFPVLGESECYGSVKLSVEPEQRRAVMQMVKRVSRSNNYFAAIQQDEVEHTNGGTTQMPPFPMFVNIFAAERFADVSNNLRPIVKLEELHSDTKTPGAYVIKVSEDYIAEGIESEASAVALAQSRGDFYDLTLNGGIYAFSVM